MPKGEKPTENEHFVPRMYLKCFSEINKSGKALIWQFNLKTMRQTPVQVDVQDICFEKHLYEIKGSDGSYATVIDGWAYANCPELLAVGIGYEVKSLAGNVLNGSPKAALYTGSRKTRDKAQRAGLRFTEDRFFACDLLPDGTLRLTGWRWGDDRGTFVVPATWCGLPVSTVSLYRSTGQLHMPFKLRSQTGEIEH